MPYVDQAARERVDTTFQPENAGELNYLFTSIAADYLTRKGLRYQNLNDLVGALEGAKLELYRRVAAPYENIKIADNGDAYPLELTER